MLIWQGGLEEEVAWVCYVEWFSDSHTTTVSYTRYCVKGESDTILCGLEAGTDSG